MMPQPFPAIIDHLILFRVMVKDCQKLLVVVVVNVSGLCMMHQISSLAGTPPIVIDNHWYQQESISTLYTLLVPTIQGHFFPSF